MNVIELEEQFENFEGSFRRMEGLISQLELWSDDCTINHKKEEVRLPQYIEIHQSLEEVKDELESFMAAQQNNVELAEKLANYKKLMAEKLEAYKETEAVIHEWIKEIKNIHVLIAKSSVLQANREWLEAICAK